MDPIATNDIVNAGDNLANERNLDKPTDVEQHGENEQNSAPEQVFETNASGSHIEGQTYNISSTRLLDWPKIHAGIPWRVDVAWGPRKRKRGETLTLVHAVVFRRVDVAW